MTYVGTPEDGIGERGRPSTIVEVVVFAGLSRVQTTKSLQT